MMAVDSYPTTVQYWLCGVTLGLGLAGTVLQMFGSRLESRAAGLFENYPQHWLPALVHVVQVRTAAERRKLTERASRFSNCGTATLFFALVSGLTISFVGFWSAAVAIAALSLLWLIAAVFREGDVARRLDVFVRSQEVLVAAARATTPISSSTLDYVMRTSAAKLLLDEAALAESEAVFADDLREIRKTVDDFEATVRDHRSPPPAFTEVAMDWFKANSRRIAVLVFAVVVSLAAWRLAGSTVIGYQPYDNGHGGTNEMAIFQNAKGLVNHPIITYNDGEGQEPTLSLVFTPTRSTASGMVMFSSTNFKSCAMRGEQMSPTKSGWWTVPIWAGARAVEVICSPTLAGMPLDTPRTRYEELGLWPARGWPDGIPGSFVRVGDAFLCAADGLNARIYPMRGDREGNYGACGSEIASTLTTTSGRSTISYGNPDEEKDRLLATTVFALLLALAGAAWWDLVKSLLDDLASALGATK